MKSKYKKQIKTYYKYLITKGEIEAHNNSKVLKNELKKIINSFKKI